MIVLRGHRFTRLQVLVHIGGIFPLAWLIFDGLNNNLTVNPIQALTQRTGKTALIFLVLSLSCTPLNTLFGFRDVLKVRRPLGLYAFMYASIHFFIFVGLDYLFDPRLLREAIFEKPYALVGFAAFLILLPLAITSFKSWMKRLGKNWKKLHRLVYLAAVLVVVHYFWVTKGGFFSLSGNILQPLIFGGIVGVLLILRIPVVRGWVNRTRQARFPSLRNPRPIGKPESPE